jgi:hypothetical protein
MTTHVKVSRAVHDMLKGKKDELGLRSVDAVIQHLCSDSQDGMEEDPPANSDGEDVGEPVKRRRIDVREPLYSLEILAERPGMLEYYTGFDRVAVDLLIRRFREVRLSHSFFRHLLFRQEASWGYGSRLLFLSPSCRSLSLTLLIGGRATMAFESSIWRSESSCFLLG